MMNKKLTLLAVLALILGLGLFLAGCESDSVAPNEEAPALTDGEVAGQAAAMASAAAQVLPQMVEYSPISKDIYSYDFSGEDAVTGTVYFDFRTGGADGTAAAYNVGDWCHMYTMSGESITFAVGIGGEIQVTVDVMASIVQATSTATLLEGSTGTFTAGVYSATFSFANVVVTAGQNYPSGGTMTFVSAGRTMTVTFDGDHTAVVSLDGGGSWTLDLDDGSVTAIG